jgi:hypothetical protein
MKRLAEQTLYEILEVPSDAPPATLKAAIERAREIFGPGSLAMYTLMSPDEASLMNRRIEEAWTTLLDPEARARYDAGLGRGAGAAHVATWTMPPVIPARTEAASTTSPASGEGSVGAALAGMATPGPGGPPSRPEPPPAARFPLQLVEPARAVEPSQPHPPPVARAPIRLDRPVSVPQAAMTPPPVTHRPETPADPLPALGDDAQWTGEVLRRVREARGIPIQVIADRTKVTRHHLENIEADRFGLLPAPVYLRGILLSLARELRLDGQRVARSYLDRMAAATAPPPPAPGPKR